MGKSKIIRATTVPMSISAFVLPLIPELVKKYDVTLLSSEGKEWNEIETVAKNIKNKGENIDCIKINMERHISPLKDLKSLWKLLRTFKKVKPDMVHSMTPKAGLLCMLAGKLTGVPVRVHTFTGLVFPTSTGLKRKILMFTDRLTCACATHIIPEGEGVKNDLLNYGITRKPIKVLGYGNCKGIDLEYFDPSKADAGEWKDENKVTFIAIGRLVGDKGINELVEAFVRLNKEFSNTRLILVGPEEKELDPLKPETIEAINKCNSIYTVGSQKDVRPWFAASDVAVLASYREGFPNVVIEAGAMGLPQIVTNINGAREIIIDGKNGVIIPSKNSNALYESMKKMLDKEYRNSLSVHARELIASRYEQGFVRKCLFDFYDEILGV